MIKLVQKSFPECAWRPSRADTQTRQSPLLCLIVVCVSPIECGMLQNYILEPMFYEITRQFQMLVNYS